MYLASHRSSPHLLYRGEMKRGNVQVDKGTSTVSGGDRKRVKLQAPEPEFQKLNQSDPVHARRIQQRRRMVSTRYEQDPNSLVKYRW